MGKLMNLGKICVAILAIGAVMAVIGSTQWASKADFEELKAKYMTTEANIIWIRDALKRIEGKL